MKNPVHLLMTLFLFAGLAACTTIEEVIEEMHENGNAKVVAQFEVQGENKTKVGETRYYENGQKEISGSLNKEGKREGTWSYWYKSGQLWTTGEYKNGLQEGLKVVWWENGQKRYEGQYKNDKPVGSWVFWSEKGVVQKELDYDNFEED